MSRANAEGGGGGREGSPLRCASRYLHTRVAEDKRPTLDRASIRARMVSGLGGRVWSRGARGRMVACQDDAMRNIS